jgi:hypothetical protein
MSLISLDFSAAGSHHSKRFDAAANPDMTLPSTSVNQSDHSSLREKLVEHLFVGELLRCLWLKGYRDIEVLRVEVDAFGYDLAIEVGGILRHIQLKSSARSAKTNSVNIGLALAGKPSGCVVWLWFDPSTLGLGPFLWLGAGPGLKLPDLGSKPVKHSKANRDGIKAVRPNLREVSKGRFTRVETLGALAEILFGPDDLQPFSNPGLSEDANGQA